MTSDTSKNPDLDRFKIQAYRKAALVLLVVGFLIIAFLFAQKEALLSPLGALAIILLVAGLPFTHMADKIEKAYDLETADEVSAFLSGADPDKIERDRTSSKASRRVRRTVPAVLVAAAFIAVVAAIVGVIAFA